MQPPVSKIETVIPHIINIAYKPLDYSPYKVLYNGVEVYMTAYYSLAKSRARQEVKSLKRCYGRKNVKFQKD